ncbi:MAG: tyrosine-protein phosphatase [Armatimonadetes bacterium]|nr:tyrosine-protein phosphatase [Armatimonadota bacterium]MDE2206465.1 tyrosine-protein phosphatase [Armatimonadota bacterium]
MSISASNSAPPSPSRHGRRLARKAAIGLVVFLVPASLFLWYIGVFGGNVRVVVPGVAYRSAELTGSNLGTVLKQDGIRTVINLRGGSMKNAWYRSELAECAAHHVRHVDVPMSALRYPSPAALDGLLAAFDKGPYPVLFHCAGGADRSGLAGTLFLDVYRHVPLDAAENRQLTWRYGHMAFTETHFMNDFFTLYRNTGAGMPLRTWIVQKYPALYAALPSRDRGAGFDLTPTAPAKVGGT